MAFFTLKQSERIKSDDHFKYFFSHSKKISTPFFILYFSPKYSDTQKIAFIASKKVGNAVNRNRSKRILREQISQQSIHPDVDIALVAKKHILSSQYDVIHNKLIESLKTVKLYLS